MAWRGTIAVLAGLLLIAACGIAAAATAADSAVTVVGDRHIGADLIRSYFHAAPDGRHGAAQLDAAVKALYASGLFQDVSIARDGDRVLVKVLENPAIVRLAFEGN